MLESDHLDLQDNNQESLTRPKLKRLILEYLQKRSRRELVKEVLGERDENFESGHQDFGR